MANAQTESSTASSERPSAGPLFASSMARIGAGGNFAGGTDNLLSETRRHTSLLQKIANGVSRSPTQQIEAFTLN
jgi:hypothetical protein